MHSRNYELYGMMNIFSATAILKILGYLQGFNEGSLLVKSRFCLFFLFLSVR